VWWNPDAGVSPAERDWLETKYPGWNANFGKQWDVITKNVRKGAIPQTLPQTFPMICNLCQIPIITPSNPNGQHHLGPYPLDYNGRRYLFCSEPCKWIFEQNPSRYAGHKSVIDRFLLGEILPPDLGGALAYMGNPQEVGGQDADNYAWAQEAPEPIAVG
jgi:toluene monooxygenase system protein A